MGKQSRGSGFGLGDTLYFKQGGQGWTWWWWHSSKDLKVCGSEPLRAVQEQCYRQRRNRQHNDPELLLVSDLWYSTQGAFAPMDIWQCLGKVGGYHWHLLARSQEWCLPIYSVGNSLPRQRKILPKMSVGLMLRNPKCEKWWGGLENWRRGSKGKEK